MTIICGMRDSYSCLGLAAAIELNAASQRLSLTHGIVSHAMLRGEFRSFTVLTGRPHGCEVFES